MKDVKYLVVLGNLSDQMRFFGPYNSSLDAHDAGKYAKEKFEVVVLYQSFYAREPITKEEL